MKAGTGPDLVVVHTAPPSQIEAMARRAWDDYCRLRAIAEQSRRFEDGAAAGRAWGRFVVNYERSP